MKPRPGRPYVRFRFGDGTHVDIDEEYFRAQERQQHSWLGKLGGRKRADRKAVDIQLEITSLYYERLFGAEQWMTRHWRESRRAQNAARAWVVAKIARRYGMSSRTARRLV